MKRVIIIFLAVACEIGFASESGSPETNTIMEAKPHISATLLSPALVKIPVGEMQDLTLEFSVPPGTESFDINLNTGPFVDVIQSKTIRLQDQNRLTVPIKIYAKTDGRYHLNAQVQLRVNGQQQSGVFATIIQAGAEISSPPLEKSRNLPQKVVSLPARERITRN